MALTQGTRLILDNPAMPKYSALRLSHDMNALLTERFLRLLASLGSAGTVRQFCDLLFTPTETVMFMRRLQIAHMLHEGNDYRKIMKELGVGSATIKSVIHRLVRSKASFEDLAALLDEIRREIHEEIKREVERLENPRGMEALKRRYSMYYWPEALLNAMPRKIREIDAALKRKQNRKSIL